MSDLETPDDDETPPVARPRRRRADRSVGPIPVDVQSLPTWLKAAVYLGVPSVIALFLVYVLTTQMSERVQTIERTQALQQQTMEAINKGLIARQADADATRDHFDEGLRRVMAMLRVTCVAAAETDAQQANCLRERETR